MMATSHAAESSKPADFETLKGVCRTFLTELMAGASSCCYWMEEAKSSGGIPPPGSSSETDCTVLFDEDRFFTVKNLRAQHGIIQPLFGNNGVVDAELVLSLDDFDLIIECFLRCQSMSTFISSRPKTEMAFC
jgi:hypothetical protein